MPVLPDNVRKIAVLRANGVGDFMFSLPALDAIRRAYPRAEIVLLGLPWHASFLAGRPSPVDRVVTVPVSRGIREENGSTANRAELDAFFAAMQEEKFDIALQMHGGGRYSNPFILNLKARLTAGLRTPDAASLDITIRYIYFQPEILRYLEVAGLIGAKPVTLEPRLSVTERDAAESLSVVTPSPEPLVALVPGAGDARRRWPPEKFAVLADRLADAGARVVVSGGVSDQPAVDAIVRHARPHSVEVCNTLSLGGLAGLLARCALVVGNDSGPLQLANAVGTATVGIYWCGNLITAEPITRRLHRPLLSWRLECPVCGVNCIYGACDHRESFVADVTVDEVWEQAADLLVQASRTKQECAT